MPDGKILAVGVRLIARLTSNGILDQTFNGTGYKLLTAGNYIKIKPANDGNYIILDGSDGGQLQKIDSDGNFVSAFTTFNQPGNYVDMHVDMDGKIYLLKHINYVYSIVRINQDGILDSTFGTNGQINLGSDYRYGKILVKSNNEILLAGKQQISINNRKIVVSKITSAGILDSAFGTGGHFLYPGAGEYVGDVNQLEVLDDGKILGLTSGTLCSGNSCFGLIMYRLMPNGTLDTSFKNFGTFVLPIQSDSPPMKIQRYQDGSNIVSGTGIQTMYVIKIDYNGNLDTSFGLNGKIITPQLAGSGYPVYNRGFELYGNSLVLAGVYSIFSGGQLKYVGTVRKYFFNAGGLSTSEIDKEKSLNIYPNPVKDYLHFQTKMTIDGMEIYDQSGKISISRKSDLLKNSIDVKNLPSGIYILKIKTDNRSSSVKFIKL